MANKARDNMKKRGAYVDNKLAQLSGSWPSGGLSPRKIVPQAAPSFGQPRPISRLVGLSSRMPVSVRAKTRSPADRISTIFDRFRKKESCSFATSCQVSG